MAGTVTCADTYDIASLLSGIDRNYLVHNNGDQVQLEDLRGKFIGLYFSASRCSPCREFTPKLIGTYHDLSSQSKPFEVIFISNDEDEESFTSYFSEMPWLAIPFSDTVARERLDSTFEISGVPKLIMFDADGNVLSDDAGEMVAEHGSDAYPFTTERLSELNEIFEAQKRKQTIRSLLVHGELDYVVSSQGDKVPVSELEGKYVGLYFDDSFLDSAEEFSSTLFKIQKKLKQNGESFEIVTIILDDEESSFNEIIQKLPFLAIPFEDERIEMLEQYFEVKSLPMLAIFGPDGKTLSTDHCADAIEEHGVEAWVAFPFSEDKMAILEDKAVEKVRPWTYESLLIKGELDYVIDKDGTEENIEDLNKGADNKAWKRKQTIRSLLVHGELDYVVSSRGDKVSVSELEGKYVGLYFEESYMDLFEDFSSILSKIWEKLKQNGKSFEIVTIIKDNEESSFNEIIENVPFLAIPFEDKRIKMLEEYFEVATWPTLVIIGPDGRTLSTSYADTIDEYEVAAWVRFPFSQDKEAIFEQEARNRVEKQTLESLLVEGKFDYVVGKDGTKIPVSDLVGKTIILLFSGDWCRICQGFLPYLIEMYHKIKSKYMNSFEIVLISCDRDQESYCKSVSSMPWLALPYKHPQESILKTIFQLTRIPTLIVIGPSGELVRRRYVKQLLILHGADAYPFTDERIKELEDEMYKEAKNDVFPEKDHA